MDKEITYSKCGFSCVRCPAFKDNSQTEADRRRGSLLWEKYFGLRFKPEIVRCEGCQATAPWQNGNLLPSRSCPIRVCAVYGGVATCAHCSRFPCEEYSKQIPGPELRQQRESAAKVKFSDEEYLAYIEPFDGRTHLQKLRAVLRAEDIVPAKSIPAPEGIVPFPAKTGLSRDKEKGMRLLHTLLKWAFSQQAATYAGQILNERKKPYLWGILWVMGLYGDLRNATLILESETCGEKKECSRLVRKRDNALFEPVRDATESLRKFGIQITFKPSRKMWTLTLGVEKTAGGERVLGALKLYVSSLVKKYGEPVYVSSYNLKGRAFKLFTRLDMSDL